MAKNELLYASNTEHCKVAILWLALVLEPSPAFQRLPQALGMDLGTIINAVATYYKDGLFFKFWDQHTHAKQLISASNPWRPAEAGVLIEQPLVASAANVHTCNTERLGTGLETIVLLHYRI